MSMMIKGAEVQFQHLLNVSDVHAVATLLLLSLLVSLTSGGMRNFSSSIHTRISAKFRGILIVKFIHGQMNFKDTNPYMSAFL
jgi:hypothetical protein